MANKYLDNDGLLYLWQKIKATFAGQDDVPAKSTTPPLMDGTASAGTATTYAAGDHVHPSDTTKVDKEAGKGLSTNDYTTAEKNKLSGIDTGAEVNVIESVKVNGTALTVTSKAVDVTVPTKTSDLTNDAGFITEADVPEGASASTATPLMDGTAAVGTSTAFARGDHRHPSDTSRVPTTRTVAGHALSADVTLVKGDVGLGNVDNTADVDKPVSTAVQTALDDKVDKVTGKGLSTNDYTTAEKNKLAAFGDASTYALKSDITNMYKYKGSVATVSALPSTGNTTGDVYNVEANGMNYAWNGTEWDSLGEIFTITAITNGEIDTIVAS